jgi:hypothetical protein
VEPRGRGEPQGFNKLGSVNPLTGAWEHVDLLSASGEESLERAMARILKPTLDGRKHWLRNLGARRELPLCEAFSKTCVPYQLSGIHPDM